MKRLLPLLLPCLLCLPWFCSAADKPNIIVILTDDQGYADLGAQGVVKDIRTPNLDRLAREGVRCSAGYVTAPQCVPSRAGLMTGRYQQRFGVDRNGRGPLPLEEKTLADRLKAVGYVTGQVGKWHLDPGREDTEWLRKNIPGFVPTKNGRPATVPRENAAPYLPGARGFTDFFCGFSANAFANFNLKGEPLKPEGEAVPTGMFRLDAQTEAALAFIQRRHEQRFFLYLAYAGPHTPLEAPEKYLSRFPGPMPQRRRLGLAMLSAIDDGVGRILDLLAALKLDEKTLVVFTSDNGAPLKINKPDEPLPKGMDAGWDGSVNDPWLGEKGMLSEGGIREPFLLRWKGRLPAGKVYDQPVSSLDFAATSVAAAGLKHDATLDGVNLIPYLTGENNGAPHEALYWRFWRQAAVRCGQWKLLRLSDGTELLFDLASDAHEKNNVIAAHADIATQLRDKLTKWTASLNPPGLPAEPLSPAEIKWFESCLGTKHVAPAGPPGTVQGWLGRNCKLSVRDGALRVEGQSGTSFITRAGLDEAGPVEVRLRVRSEKGGPGKIEWRPAGAKDFDRKHIMSFALAAGDWQDVKVALPIAAGEKLIHLRVYLPAAASPVQVESIQLFGNAGKPVREWAF
ncbi:MAG: sulfatase-like hydrolase/transferase [Verrucomicrobia bacterium]|nr:sulfatase-like hydrolase/transferase [Verrucomicrobiota bacterium]